MPQGSDQEKSEQATPKRLQEMREKGQVAKSREVPSAVILIASLLIFYFLGSAMIKDFMELMEWSFANSARFELRSGNFNWLLLELFRRGIKIVAPLFVALMVAGLLSNIVQVGFLFSTKAIAPKFSKLDPLKGFGRMVSKQALVELIKSLFKIAVVGCVTYFTVKGESGW